METSANRHDVSMDSIHIMSESLVAISVLARLLGSSSAIVNRGCRRRWLHIRELHHRVSRTFGQIGEQYTMTRSTLLIPVQCIDVDACFVVCITVSAAGLGAD